MADQKYAAYVVIKILTFNQNGRDKYVCIPSSWIKVLDQDKEKNNVVFGYPSDDEKLVERVIENQPLDKKWPAHYGEVVFHDDSQVEAFRFLKSKNGNRYQEDVHDRLNKQIKKHDAKKAKITESTLKRSKPMKQSSGKTKRPTKRKIFEQENVTQHHAKSKKTQEDERFELEKLKVAELLRSYQCDSDDELNVFPSTSNSPLSTQIPDTTGILYDETNDATDERFENKENSDNNKSRRRSTRQSKISRSYIEYADEDFDRSDDSNYSCSDDKEMSSLEILEQDSNLEDSYSPKATTPKKPTQSGIKSSKNSPDQDIYMDNNKIYSHCRNFYGEFSASYQKTMSILDNAADYLQKLIAAHKEKISSSVQTNEQFTDPNNHSISQAIPCTAVPTSDNSRKDTKWTLKYQKLEPETTELLPHSGVYVSKTGLNECKASRKDATKFARGLLGEVFTEEALKECSYTGSTPKRRRQFIRTRPGLDLNARQTLVSYVMQYAFQMGWKGANTDQIIISLKNKLQAQHRKHKKSIKK